MRDGKNVDTRLRDCLTVPVKAVALKQVAIKTCGRMSYNLTRQSLRLTVKYGGKDVCGWWCVDVTGDHPAA